MINLQTDIIIGLLLFHGNFATWEGNPEPWSGSWISLTKPWAATCSAGVDRRLNRDLNDLNDLNVF